MLRFKTVTILAALLLLAGSAVAQPVLESQGAAAPRLPGGAAVLYDQTNNSSGNGSPDQDFEPAFDIYDSMAADDFIVDNPVGWDIDGVETVGTNAGVPSTNVSVTFYGDGGNEEPNRNDVICEYIELVQGVDYTDAGGSLSITLPVVCKILSGTKAWMSVFVRQDFGTSGQHFWSNRTTIDFDGAVWKNAGNGFGTGCVDWTTMTFCGVGGGFPDFLFQILGEKNDTGDGTDGTPAVGPFGVLLMVLALGGGSGYVMARRRRA